MPQTSDHIFNQKSLNASLKNKTIEDLTGKAITAEEIKTIILNWQTLIQKGILSKKNEISLQDSFLSDFFVKILQYKSVTSSPEGWNYEREQTTASDAALGFFGNNQKDEIHVAVELKSAKMSLDQKQIRKGSIYTPVEQAFMYANKFGKCCKWVVASNYKEIRLYQSSSMNEYESFNIETLFEQQELKKFLFLLFRTRLIEKGGESQIDRLFLQNEAEQEKISKVFYEQYKKIRFHLFEHLKQKNPGVAELLLLEKTQKILDRFIFICFCEDTGLLPEMIFRKVIEAVKTKSLFVKISAWDQIRALFRSIDKGNPTHNINRYNGGLFAYDELLDGQLCLDDEIIHELSEITNYDFESDLNVNILGHIFEQSISDIEELKAWILGQESDKKKGKRKKEGIYYTPEYITRYIVEQAVGGWLKERREELGFNDLPELTEKDMDSIKFLKKGGIRFNKNIQVHLEFWEAYKKALSNIKVLDPACGSGAFLNQTFNYLFKEGQDVNRQIADLRKGQMDIFGLDKHILQNNLFGVDLNPESVEITKLGLWLKTANKFSELTALDKNILCGNSLIDDPVIADNKAFKWDENFSEIMKDGGFDVVIGNPPYVRLETMKETSEALSKMNYLTFEKRGDLYVLFVEQGFKQLKTNGYISYIMPNKWIQAGYGKALREYFLQYELQQLIDFGDIQIFEGATTYPCIFVAKKAAPKPQIAISKLNSINMDNFETHVLQTKQSFNFESFSGDTWIISSNNDQALLEKLKTKFSSLADFVGGEANYGIKTGLTEAFLIDEARKDKLIKEDINSAKIIKSVIRGRDIKPWLSINDNSYLIGTFPALKIDIDQYPAIKSYLLSFTKERLEQSGAIGSRKKTNNKWFETQDTISYYEEFAKPKIMYQAFQVKPCFIYDEQGLYCNNSMWIIPTDNKALLAILNSKMGWWLITKYCTQIQNGYQLIWKYFGQIPIPNTTSELFQKADLMLSLNIAMHAEKQNFINSLKEDKGISNITKALENFNELDFEGLKNEIGKQKARFALGQETNDWREYFNSTKQKVNELQSQINQTDKEIDQMVYELYGLTEDEIKIVESE